MIRLHVRIPFQSTARSNCPRARLYRAEEPEWNVRTARILTIADICRETGDFCLNSRGQGHHDN